MNIKPEPSIIETSQVKLRGFLFFPLLLIFFSCAGTPVSFNIDEAPLFAVIEDAQPHWPPFSDDVPLVNGFPLTGLDYFHGRIKSPSLEFWALRIDLTSPDMQIVVRDGAAGEDGQTLSTRVSSFVRDNALAAGINSVPFDISSHKEGQPIVNMGIVISEGEQLAPANLRYDALVFYKDGKAAIVSQAELTDKQTVSQIKNAVGGFHRILINGEPAQRTQDREVRYPRTAAGISADGQYLYLLVIDGRRLLSIGSTEKETAFLLRQLGSLEGINLDGGGSTALALRYRGKTKTVNTPIHGGIPGLERAVAGCLGVRPAIFSGR